MIDTLKVGVILGIEVGVLILVVSFIIFFMAREMWRNHQKAKIARQEEYKVGDYVTITDIKVKTSLSKKEQEKLKEEFRNHIGKTGIIYEIETMFDLYPYNVKFIGYSLSCWGNNEIRKATDKEIKGFEQLKVERAI